jgi:glycosyltransferase involved in cell wall biosynthesis
VKIIFFTHYFPPEVNAPASRTYENAKRWVKAGHSVKVVTCAPNCPDGIVFNGYKNRILQKEMMDGVEVVRVWTYVAPNAGALPRIINYLSYSIMAFIYGLFCKKPDILIATSPQFFCGWTGVMLKWFRRFKFILEIRDIWPESITTVGAMKQGVAIRFLEKMEKTMYNTADRIVAVGNGYKNRIMEKGVSESKIDVIYNGVDMELFKSSEKEALVLAERFKLSGFKIISYVGTIGMAHALEVVLRAAEKVKDKPWRFVIAGDGARRKELEEEAKRLGLNNVVFTGRLAKSQMPALWSLTDISFIHLKKSDLFTTVIPSKMFESMAMRKPILMGVDGEARMLIEEAGSGFFVTPESESELLSAIDKIFSDDELYRKLGENGYSFVKERFNRDKLALDYLTVMEKI